MLSFQSEVYILTYCKKPCITCMKNICYATKKQQQIKYSQWELGSTSLTCQICLTMYTTLTADFADSADILIAAAYLLVNLPRYPAFMSAMTASNERRVTRRSYQINPASSGVLIRSTPHHAAFLSDQSRIAQCDHCTIYFQCIRFKVVTFHL